MMSIMDYGSVFDMAIMLISPLSGCSLRGVDISDEYQLYFIGIASHIAELVKKDLCTIIACLDSFGFWYCIHDCRAIDNDHFVL